MDWSIVVTSAGVAALVSGGMTIAGQYFERKSRRKELLLSKAVEVSKEQVAWATEANKHDPTIVIPTPIVNVDCYFRELNHIFDKGHFSEETKKEIEREKRST